MVKKVAPLMTLDDVSVIFENNPGAFQQKKRVGAALNVSFDINPGEIIAVVGESGCGKTTIGKTITGIHKPTGGRVLYNGNDITTMARNSDEYRDYRLGVQIVHQDSYAALNPSRTIFQSLSAPILRHKLARNRLGTLAQLVDLFTLVGLTPAEDFLFKYPHQLSGGQRQRTLLARALSVKPKLIVADEPVSMVDVSLRISLLDLMSRMNEEMNVAFIYITHDLATARYIAKNGRIIVMYLGRVVETGDLNEVLEKPRHPYLQALLAAIPLPDPKISRANTELPLRSVDMPSNVNPPPGCRFHPRCPYWKEICAREEPQLRAFSGGMIACHFAEEIPEWRW
ncbi:MAG: oligopeptide/dipeptide ABC transporter ATP-binding protein [Christensenellales bacterium]|jgi:peptide/nickel transport system ATP-binding protein